MGGVGALPRGEKLSIHSLELFTVGVLRFVTFHLLCEVSGYADAGAALPVVDPDVS